MVTDLRPRLCFLTHRHGPLTATRRAEHTCDAYQGQSGSSMWDPQGRVRSVLVAGLGYKSTNLATPLQQEVSRTRVDPRFCRAQHDHMTRKQTPPHTSYVLVRLYDHVA